MTMSEVAGQIGTNLRRLRADRRLSLAALARASGIAKATLTKLESGRGNPTIDTLYALADSLGVSLGELLAEPSPGAVKVVRTGDGVRVAGAVEARLLDRIYARGLVEVFEVHVGPVPRRATAHPRGVIESILVTKGRLRVGPVEEPVELGPGDFVHFPGDRPHSYVAIGEFSRAVVIMSYA